MKTFCDIDEQINRLKSRKVIIKDEDMAKQYLLLNNYYNIINSCARPFLQKDPNSENYLDGTTFEEIIAIHKFESDIKQDLLEYLLIIEKHLKSTMAYIFCKHNQSPYSCLSKDSFNFTPDTILNISNSIQVLAKKITEQIKQPNHNPIKHYAYDHNDVPMYVLINELTFGNIVHLFKIMNYEERAEIINIFCNLLAINVEEENVTINHENFDRLLKNLLTLRNFTAHNASLFAFSAKSSIKYIPELHKFYNIKPEDPKQDLYNVIITFACFLPKNDYRKFYNSILKRCKRLSNNLKTIQGYEVYCELGFPKDFDKYSKLQQVQ